MVHTRHLLGVIAFAMIGCGDETTTLAKAYPNVASLPACDEASAGSFALVEETGTFHVCDGTTWKASGTASIMVPNTDALPECSDANRGAVALIEDESATTVCTPDGWAVSNTVRSSLSCAGTLEHDELPVALKYEYQYVQISPSGDIWAHPSLTGTDHTISDSALYSAQQQDPGSVAEGLGFVEFQADFIGDVNASNWRFFVDDEDDEFDQLVILYDDIDVADLLSWTIPFEAQDCSFQAF